MEENIKISKYLSYLLRHGADKNGLRVSSDGYVSVSSILNIPKRMQNYELSVDIIKDLIEKMKFKRFELKRENDEYLIRAVYGHTMPALHYDAWKNMRPIVVPKPLLIRHMLIEKWKDLRIEHKGLNDLHLPLSHQYPDDDYYKKTCPAKLRYVVIEIDMEAAMKDGMKFYFNEENFVLTPGIHGVILPKYFKKVSRLPATTELKKIYYLCYLLRHGGLKGKSFKVSSDGYASVSSILKLYDAKHIHDLSLEVIKELIYKMDQKRLQLKQEENGEYLIRALYRHSTPAVDYDLMDDIFSLIRDPLPLVRYMQEENWQKLHVEDKGIMDMNKRMNIDYPNGYKENKVDYVIIEIDMEAAMKDGMKFYFNEENYVLTPGIDGVILPKYFKKVTHYKIQDVKED